MNPLTKYLPVDKQMHLAAGLLIAVAISWFFGPAIGLAVGCFAGACKEGYDAYMNAHRPADTVAQHDVDVMDFIWTCAGSTIGCVIIGVFNYATGRG